MIYRHLKQKSRDWFDMRRGRVCSSDVGRIIDANGKLKASRSGKGYSDAVYTYAHQLIAERAGGYIDLSEFASRAMEYGIRHEAAARSALSLFTDLEFATIGGVLSECGRWWASTDAVAESGGEVVAVAEIKIPNHKTQVGYLLNPDWLWADYKPQLAFEMIVSGAKVGFLFSYGAELGLPQSNVLLELASDAEYVVALRESLEQFDRFLGGLCSQLGVDNRPPKPPVSHMSDREQFEKAFGLEAA